MRDTVEEGETEGGRERGREVGSKSQRGLKEREGREGEGESGRRWHKAGSVFQTGRIREGLSCGHVEQKPNSLTRHYIAGTHCTEKVAVAVAVSVSVAVAVSLSLSLSAWPQMPSSLPLLVLKSWN
eukprot:1930807-Rhodomonas_salina.1